VCTERGEVAFGSWAWDVFSELDFICEEKPIPVYIYASRDETRSGGAKVSWRAQ
jgi:hypothetical protein